MIERVILQTEQMGRQRFIDQLRCKQVRAGQYFGGKSTVQRWAQLTSDHPMRTLGNFPERKQLPTRFNVVDLGPGTGEPCLALTAALADRIDKYVLVDVSPAMLDLAEAAIGTDRDGSICSIVADFLLDNSALRRTLWCDPTPQLVLCLGGTAGNFPLGQSLPALRDLLRPSDLLVIDLGVYPADEADPSLREAAAFYASRTNCDFGLQFLVACGHTPDYARARADVAADCTAPNVKIIRGHYEFAVDAQLRIDEEVFEFEASDLLQWLESRRFDAHDVADLLAQFELASIANIQFPGHALHLCRVMESAE